MNYSLPPMNSALPVTNNMAQWTKPWGNWLSQSFIILQDAQNSGPTTKRPTTDLYPGKFYFDTSLGANGKPIWRNKGSTGWILADGTAA